MDEGNHRLHWIVRLRNVMFAGLLLICSSITWAAVSSGGRPADGPCDAPAYHQFDFWVGDWDVFEVDTGVKDAHVTVDRILDGCVLHETYSDSGGHKGQSFSIFDATRNVWHQTWVTNRGELLVIEGSLQRGVMIFEGADRTAGGTERKVRGIWKPMADGVRETAVRSTDGGKTWKPWFDLMFRPTKKP